MIGTIVHQLLDKATPEMMREHGMDPYYIDHGFGIFPAGASGHPWTAAYIQSKGDPITDLYEDMAAEAAIIKEQPKTTIEKEQL